MKPSTSENELRGTLALQGLTLETLKPGDALRLMTHFYRTVRAEGCLAPPERDKLLFQWGTHDWGAGLIFELELTRQFIEGDDDGAPDEDVTSQLSLTFHYAATPALEALKAGNRWCEGVDDLAGFEAFVAASDALRAAESLTAQQVVLEYQLE
ncbi:MAG: hypothetical protein WDO13_12870 [Verrucomicrobiota bacterium]